MLAARLAACVAAFVVTGCAVGPDYRRPDAPVPAAYREVASLDGAAGWAPASPHIGDDWWRGFDDAPLDALMARVDVSNQNLRLAVANFAQARALVAQQRAGLWPSLGLSTSAQRTGGSGRVGGTGSALQAGLDASWAPDVWGRLGRAVEAASASAEASAADLAAARLAVQGELATNYFSLRDADAELALLRRTTEGYERSLQITRNRYAAGIAARTDVLQAETQLASARADRVGLGGDRARLEHAIAVLVGAAPGDFTVAPGEWSAVVPSVPTGLPSTLLERRPDIASAERAVAAANAQIGVQRSAYFPSLGLSASLASGAGRVGDLFGASTSLWALGLSAAQTLFDAGATRAAVAGAEAGRDAAIARYRQTVLTAFQAVEDQLAQARSLAEQAELRRQASEAADLIEQQLQNRYLQGLVDYTDVVTAQTAALNARRALAQVRLGRQLAAVGLFQALGGGWSNDGARSSPAIERP